MESSHLSYFSLNSVLKYFKCIGDLYAHVAQMGHIWVIPRIAKIILKWLKLKVVRDTQ